MDNSNRAALIGIGFLLGAAAGLAAGIIYANKSADSARELQEEKERLARFRSPGYAERAREAIEEARRSTKVKSTEA